MAERATVEAAVKSVDQAERKRGGVTMNTEPFGKKP